MEEWKVQGDPTFRTVRAAESMGKSFHYPPSPSPKVGCYFLFTEETEFQEVK